MAETIRILNVPYFVKCGVDSYTSHGVTYFNSPVNLLQCKSIERVKINGESYIKFIGCGVAWRFDSDQHRDDQYRVLMRKL